MSDAAGGEWPNPHTHSPHAHRANRHAMTDAERELIDATMAMDAANAPDAIPPECVVHGIACTWRVSIEPDSVDRRFWVCSQPKGEACSFFEWIDGADGSKKKEAAKNKKEEEKKTGEGQTADALSRKRSGTPALDPPISKLQRTDKSSGDFNARWSKQQKDGAPPPHQQQQQQKETPDVDAATMLLVEGARVLVEAITTNSEQNTKLFDVLDKLREVGRVPMPREACTPTPKDV